MNNLKIKKIELVFENCEVFAIENISNLSFWGVSSNKNSQKTCSGFNIEFEKFSEKSICSYKEYSKEEIIERFNKKDCTKINVYLVGDNNAPSHEYFVLWQEYDVISDNKGVDKPQPFNFYTELHTKFQNFTVLKNGKYRFEQIVQTNKE